MKAIAAALLLCVFASIARAQSLPCGSEGGTVITTIEASVELISGGDIAYASGNDSYQVSWEIFVLLTSSGQKNYYIDPASISLAGNPTSINNTTTRALFGAMARATIAAGVAQGYTPCPGSCATPAMSEVNIPSCVGRHGTGLNTFFTTCAPGACCVRAYTVCCPNGPSGAAVINLIGSSGSTCSGSSYGASCESTCE